MGKYFGTDGFRGLSNKGLKAEHAFRIGRFIGYANKDKKIKVLIARDTRLSGKMLADSLAAGIISSGGDVVNIDVSTTPSVSYLVRHCGFDFGVMISASHNPYYDNGIKIFNSLGEKLEESIENEIEKYIDSVEDYIPRALNEKLGRYLDSSKFLDLYIDFLVSKAIPQISKLNILVDCSNGSASSIAPKLLSRLGVNASIVNSDPNGLNINDRCGSTHINNLSSVVKKGNYDIAFAFDGDADRCLAMDNEGKVIDGDAIMYLNALFLKKHNQLKNNSIVLTVMSNIGLKIALKNNNISIAEVGVGDKYVQAEMKNKGYLLGGEQSGHIIFLDDLNTGDGLLTMIKMLNLLSTEKQDVKTLLKDLTIYPQCLKNIHVSNKDAILSHQGFLNMVKECEKSLNGQGRILVRPSGTEPLIRVMAETKTQEVCEEICDKLINYINDLQ